MKVLIILYLTINSLLGFQNICKAQVAESILSGPQITFDFVSYDFGNIQQGNIGNIEFRFQNTGNEPLTISNVLTSCGCTVSDWPKTPVLPGSVNSLKITFDSTGKIGQQEKVITVVSNAPNNRNVLTIEAYVLPKRSNF